MAQEILNKIREAEDKAQEIVNTAGIAARELIREANTKADGIISANAMQIKANTAEILETAEKEAVDEFEALKEKLSKEIGSKKEIAKKNLKDVRDYILGRVL
jgi:V/A-type H+/Na+-transporting ATPase subunit G/H